MYLTPGHRGRGQNHQLGDAIPGLHRVVRLGIEVDERHFDFAAIAGVDQAGGVHAGNSVPDGEPTAGQDEAAVTLGDSQGEARADEGPATARRQMVSLVRHEVAPRVADVGVSGKLCRLAQALYVEFHGEMLPKLEGEVSRLVVVMIWMDLEMTGLEPDRHVIVEIATILTDDELNVIAEGPDLVIGASNEELAQTGDFVTAMHTKSGLLERIRTATTTPAEAERLTLEFLRAHDVPASAVPLCGNSIGTDRRFLQVYMPTLESFLHYRNIDVSTLKELAKRWRPDVTAALPEKETTHRALDDIRESIAELAFYRSQFLAPPPSTNSNPS